MDSPRGKEMINYWSTVNDDELKMINQAADFLQAEYCPSGNDPIWSAEYFRWKLGPANPAGKGYLSLALFEGRVVATSVLTKKRLLIDGNECLGGEVQDAYSSAAVRRTGRPIRLSPKDSDPNSYINKSIFGRLASEVRERADAEGISVIYGTPNSNSYPAYVKKLDFFDCQKFQIESFHRPTWRLFIRKYPSLRPFSALFRNLEGLSIAFQKSINSRGVGRNLAIETCVPSAGELDELWIRLKPIKGFSLIRDASYWRHRYLEHPIAKYVFFNIRERGCLVGVIITRLFSVGGDKRIVSIAEWMKDEHIPFGYMLSEVMNYYRDSEVDGFNLWAGRLTQESRSAARNLFFSRRRVPIIFAETPQARLLQGMPADIKFYLGSSDNV